MKLKDAVNADYTPCSVCNPPTLSNSTEPKGTEPQATRPKQEPKVEGPQTRPVQDQPSQSRVILASQTSTTQEPLSERPAQGSKKKPLTNADVASMVKGGVPEGTIVLAIQQSATDFDTSPQALIALKNQGFTEKILDAMLSVGTAKTRPSTERAAANSGKTGEAGEAEEANGKWLVKDQVSPIDGSRTVALLLPAEQSIPGVVGNAVPDLVVRCLGNKTEVYVATQTVLPIDLDSSGRYPVRLRLDDGQPYTEQWGESTSHDSLFVLSPVRFARQLAASSKLAFEFTPADSAPVATWFDLKGLDNVLEKVASACGWAVQRGAARGATQDLDTVRNIFLQGDKHQVSFMQAHLEKHTCLHVVSNLAEADAILEMTGDLHTKLVGKDGDTLWQRTGIRFYGPLNTAVGCPH